ncbi:hypothetical protein ACLB2K_040617 [Fragaria x ananassa]
MASIHAIAPQSFLNLPNPKPRKPITLHSKPTSSSNLYTLKPPKTQSFPSRKPTRFLTSVADHHHDVIPVQSSDCVDQQEGMVVSRAECEGVESELASQEDDKCKQILRIKKPKDRLRKFVDACKNKTKCEGGDEIDLQGGKSGQHVKQSRGGCGAQQPKFSIDGLELLAVYKSQRKQYDEEQLPEPTERKQILTAEKECNVEEIEEEEPAPSKSSKDKKANGPEKSPSLAFKFTSKVPYKTVLKAHSSVVLKAETVADKVEWIKKISKVIQPSKGVPRGAPAEGGPTMR